MQSLPKASKRCSAEDCAWELLDTAPPMMWYIRREMRSHRKGLSMPQFRAMVMIANQPAVSLSGVAEHLALSLPTTSRIVNGLVEKGLLKRADSALDRRQISLVISARGQSVLTAAWQATQQSMAQELVNFTQEQRVAVVKAMHCLKKVFGSLRMTK